MMEDTLKFQVRHVDHRFSQGLLSLDPVGRHLRLGIAYLVPPFPVSPHLPAGCLPDSVRVLPRGPHLFSPLQQVPVHGRREPPCLLVVARRQALGSVLTVHDLQADPLRPFPGGDPPPLRRLLGHVSPQGGVPFHHVWFQPLCAQGLQLLPHVRLDLLELGTVRTGCLQGTGRLLHRVVELPPEFFLPCRCLPEGQFLRAAHADVLVQPVVQFRTGHVLRVCSRLHPDVRLVFAGLLQVLGLHAQLEGNLGRVQPLLVQRVVKHVGIDPHLGDRPVLDHCLYRFAPCRREPLRQAGLLRQSGDSVEPRLHILCAAHRQGIRDEVYPGPRHKPQGK